MTVDIIYRRAGGTKRVIAFVIDLVLLNELQLILYTIGAKTGFFWLFVSYFSSMEGLWGTTVGKWALGIEVVDERGNVPGFWKALLRATLFPLFILTAHPLHETLSKTYTVER